MLEMTDPHIQQPTTSTPSSGVGVDCCLLYDCGGTIVAVRGDVQSRYFRSGPCGQKPPHLIIPAGSAQNSRGLTEAVTPMTAGAVLACLRLKPLASGRNAFLPWQSREALRSIAMGCSLCAVTLPRPDQREFWRP